MDLRGGVYTYAVTKIDSVVEALVRKRIIRVCDADEERGNLLACVWRSKHDSTMRTVEEHIDLVVNRRVKSAIRRIRARERRNEVQLSALGRDFDATESRWGIEIGRADARIDAEDIQERIPEPLNELCEGLKYMNVTRLARWVDQPRSTVQHSIKRARELLTNEKKCADEPAAPPSKRGRAK